MTAATVIGTSPADFNEQLTGWLGRANTRHHRSLGCRPMDRWAADVAAMIALPPVAPVLGWRTSTRLPRDHYVRLDANDYSVDPAAIGRTVEVVADLQQVIVTWPGPGRGRVVARHDRCWARHQTITDAAHRATALEMAGIHRAVQQAAASSGASGSGGELLVEQRILDDYDTFFGLTEPLTEPLTEEVR